MDDEICCYEPFAFHNSLNNTYLATVIKVTRTNFVVHWILDDIKFKSANEALEVANNYINKVIYGHEECFRFN